MVFRFACPLPLRGGKLAVVATFTWPSRPELEEFLQQRGVHNLEEFQGIEAGSVNSNFKIEAQGGRYFLRLYEEQDLAGAREEAHRTEELRRRGVPTPAAIGDVTLLASRPAVLLTWVEGTHSCQRGVSPARARAVGEALAKVHRAGEGVRAQQGRFTPAALSERLVTIDASPLAGEAPRLRAALWAPAEKVRVAAEAAGSEPLPLS